MQGIDWDKIKNEHPKSYLKIIDWLIYKNCIIYCDYTIRYKDVELSEFEMLYGLLEKFFDDNGIIISVVFNHIKTAYTFMISFKDKTGFYSIEPIYAEKWYKSRPKAKEQSIYKAFETMEGMLKDE